MAISLNNQVDYLFKKIGYGISKTDTYTAKAPSNETVASPLTLRGDTIWQQSGSIPATQPTSSSGVVTVYSDSTTNTVKTTADGTSTAYRTWKTGITNWIDPSFGATYQVKVYWDSTSASAPQTTGTQLFPDGTGNSDFWFFDYDSGILTFPDTIPTSVNGVTGKTIYIVGSTYTGLIGIGTINANTVVGTLATANVGLYSNVTSTSANYTYNLLFGNVTSGNTQVFNNSSINVNALSGNLSVGNITATQHNGNLLGAVLTPSQTLITTVGNLTNLTVGGNITTVGNINTLGNVTTTSGVFWPNGQAYGSGTTYANANVTALLTGLTSLVSTTGNLSAGNIITTQANLTTVIATGNVYASSLVGVQYGNVNTSYVIGGAGSINIIPGTSSVLNISSTTAMLVPSGTTAQRPTGVAGYVRYNQTTNIVEYYNGSAWIPVTTTVSDQSFSGDGASTTFNLSNTTNAAGILVSINGVVQNPNTYTVNGPGTQITFAETPLVTDVVDIRYLSVAVTNNGTFATDVSIAGNLTITGLLSSPLTTKTSTSAGVAGQIAYDANYIYICTATNTWKRVALTGGVF